MKHPFLNLTTAQRQRLLWSFLTLTLLATVVLQIIDAPLKTSAAPQGIVSFELAGTPRQSASILASWDATARLYAAFSLGFDFLYMLAYTVTIALAALWAAEAWPKSRQLGMSFAWIMGLAGGADALENVFLWRILLESASSQTPVWARAASLLKFTLIGLSILYILVALIRRWLPGAHKT